MSASPLLSTNATAMSEDFPTGIKPAKDVVGDESPAIDSIQHSNSKPEIEDLGFSVISDIESTDAAADIVFVHGLQGHPEKTFTPTTPQISTPAAANRGTFTSSGKKSRNLLQLFKKKSESSPKSPENVGFSNQKNIFWPFDLLSKEEGMKDVRILTWGYNSYVTEMFKAVSHENISHLGQNLLVGLQQVRKKEPNRPLIFVAHSLGGILVKNALHRARTSKHKPEFLPIYDSTVGIVFLGTPQSGSGVADWGLLASNLSKLALRGRNTKILEGLSPNNELLENISEEFLKLLGDNEPKIHFHSFYETKGMTGIYGLSGEVVPRKYAVVGHLRETVAGIDGNHSAVCKFPSVKHHGCVSVLGAIEDYVARARTMQMASQAREYEERPLIGQISLETRSKALTGSRKGPLDPLEIPWDYS